MFDADEETDVLVIGGGPAGCAAAIELARAGFSVVVVERSGNKRPGRAGETACPDIVPALARLGVWQRFLEQEHMKCYGLRSCWGSSSIEESSYVTSPYGHGWHVNRELLDRLLSDEAQRVGSTVHDCARIKDVRSGSGGSWRAKIQTGSGEQSISARFLVDATGRKSTLRSRFGADDHVHDQLIGIGAWFDFDESRMPLGGCALIEAVEQGWWYSAPTTERQRIAVFMTDMDLFLEGRRQSAGYWRDRLRETRHLNEQLGDARPVSPLCTYLALSHQVVGLGGPGWLPIGDALQSVDPLSGRGVCNAIESGIQAAKAITDYLHGKTDASAAYLHAAQRSFTRYLSERLDIYSTEPRWHTSVFWHRRSRTC